MTYAVVSTAAYRRAYLRLPPPVLAAVAELVDGDLRENPQRVGKPLVGEFEGQHGARRGDYRLRYRIGDGTVTLLDVKHRRDAYRPR